MIWLMELQCLHTLYISSCTGWCNGYDLQMPYSDYIHNAAASDIDKACVPQGKLLHAP